MNATCEAPGAPIHSLLAPVIQRNEPRGRCAWIVKIAALSAHECSLFAATKREVQVWTTGEPLQRWAAHAAHCLALAGTIAFAPAPTSACDRWHVEPTDQELDQGDHTPRGGWPTCGDPVVWRLGGVKDLALFRLDWTEERWQRSFDHWSVDRDARNAAWAAAETSLAAADLTQEEAAAMRATPETIGFYRLAWCLEDLRRRHHPLQGRDLGAWWASERAGTTCWAPAE